MGSATLYAANHGTGFDPHVHGVVPPSRIVGAATMSVSAGRPKPGPEVALPPKATLPHPGQFTDGVMSRTCLLFAAEATAGAGGATCLAQVSGRAQDRMTLFRPLQPEPCWGRARRRRTGAQPARGHVRGTSLLAEGVITLEAVLGVPGNSERASIALRRLACLNPKFVLQPALRVLAVFHHLSRSRRSAPCWGELQGSLPNSDYIGVRGGFAASRVRPRSVLPVPARLEVSSAGEVGSFTRRALPESKQRFPSPIAAEDGRPGPPGLER